MTETINLPSYNFDDKVMVYMELTLQSLEKGDIPLYNMTPYYGMLFDVIESSNPVVSKELHDTRKNGESMPWSFGLLNIKHSKSHQKGYYSIEKNTQGSILLKTVDPNIIECVISAYKNHYTLHFNSLPFKITKLEIHDHSFDVPPSEWNTMTINFHTVTFLRKEGEEIEFTAKNLVDFQMNKLAKMGIAHPLEFDIDPYVRILKDYTQMKYLHITSFYNDKKSCARKGKVGKIVMKVNGSEEMKDVIWNLFKISEYIGVGNRSSMGFGNISIHVK